MKQLSNWYSVTKQKFQSFKSDEYEVWGNWQSNNRLSAFKKFNRVSIYFVFGQKAWDIKKGRY